MNSPPTTNYGYIPIKSHQPVYPKSVNHTEIVEFRNELTFWSSRVGEITKHYNSSLQPAQIQQLVELDASINRVKNVLSNKDLYRSKKIPPSLPQKLPSQKKDIAPAPTYPAPKKSPSESSIRKKSQGSSSSASSSSIGPSTGSVDELVPTRQAISAPTSVRRRTRPRRKNTAPPALQRPDPGVELLESSSAPDQVQLGLALIKAVKYMDTTTVATPKSPRPPRRNKRENSVTDYPTAFMEDFERMKKLAEQQQRTIDRLQKITKK